MMTQSEYAVRTSRYFLKPIGLWAVPKDASQFSKSINLLQIFTTYWLILFALIPCALHTFLEETSTAVRIKLIGPMSFAVMAIAKYASLTQNTSKLAKCFQQVENDWKNSCNIEKKVMYENAKRSRSLILFAAFFMYGGGIFYHFVIPLAVMVTIKTSTSSEIESLNSTVNIITKWPRILTFPTYKAWMNVELSSVFLIVFIIQYLSLCTLDTITVGACSLAATFVTHICSQLDLVIMLITRYIYGNTNDKDVPFPKEATSREARLAFIVKRHMRALRFAAIIEKYLNRVCFVEFIGCTLNICLIGYYCVAEWERKEPVSTITYFMLLISFTTNIFIFCYIGELLTEKCTQVGSIYHIIQWYDLPGKSASDLLLIIAISRHPNKLTAGKFVDLTLITFSKVMKSAFTYFNIIRTSIV